MLTGTGNRIYSRSFYAGQVDGSARSASIVVPLVQSLLPVTSVVDVGCGIAPWAAEFRARGVLDLVGIDGDYVDRSQLRIPEERFLARDLTQPLVLERAFDLAVCLEVAEHLPESSAAKLVDDLTRLAPAVLFSAAIPGQDGTDHINEQYLPYWMALFEKHEYKAIDPIRPRILGNDSVEWFYQQNMVMFLGPEHHVLASKFFKPCTFIHERLYERTRNSPPPLGKIVRAFPVSLRNSLRYRLRGICGLPTMLSRVRMSAASAPTVDQTESSPYHSGSLGA